MTSPSQGSVRGDPEFAKKAVEIIRAVIFDGDVTLLFGMSQGYPRGETVLELIFEMFECGRKFWHFARIPNSWFSRFGSREMGCYQLFGIAYRGGHTDELFR